MTFSPKNFQVITFSAATVSARTLHILVNQTELVIGFLLSFWPSRSSLLIKNICFQVKKTRSREGMANSKQKTLERERSRTVHDMFFPSRSSTNSRQSSKRDEKMPTTTCRWLEQAAKTPLVTSLESRTSQGSKDSYESHMKSSEELRWTRKHRFKQKGGRKGKAVFCWRRKLSFLTLFGFSDAWHCLAFSDEWRFVQHRM